VQRGGGRGRDGKVAEIPDSTRKPTLAIGWRYFWIKQRQIVTNGKHPH